MNPSGPRQQLKPSRVPSVAALKAHLSWMPGTGSVLVASRVWAQGAEDALGAVFGLGLTILARQYGTVNGQDLDSAVVRLDRPALRSLWGGLF